MTCTKLEKLLLLNVNKEAHKWWVEDHQSFWQILQQPLKNLSPHTTSQWLYSAIPATHATIISMSNYAQPRPTKKLFSPHWQLVWAYGGRKRYQSKSRIPFWFLHTTHHIITHRILTWAFPSWQTLWWFYVIFYNIRNNSILKRYCTICRK